MSSKTAVLQINLSSPAGEGDWVRLEQEDNSSVGKVTKKTVVKYLFHIIDDGFSSPTLNCGYAGVVLYAYLSRPDLPYSINVSHGAVGSRYIQQVVHTQKIILNGGSEYSLEYPADEILGTEWNGTCYNVTGGQIPYPDVRVENNKVFLDEKVYGSITIFYKVTRHVYSVHTPKREDAEENHYSSVAYAYWRGGITWLELSLSSDVDNDFECRNGGDLLARIYMFADDDDPDDPRVLPYPNTRDKKRQYDYCTGEEIVSRIKG